jgi:hypothetical protein
LGLEGIILGVFASLSGISARKPRGGGTFGAHLSLLLAIGHDIDPPIGADPSLWWF